jgi:hypothetical protein
VLLTAHDAPKPPPRHVGFVEADDAKSGPGVEVVLLDDSDEDEIGASEHLVGGHVLRAVEVEDGAAAGQEEKRERHEGPHPL